MHSDLSAHELNVRQNALEYAINIIGNKYKIIPMKHKRMQEEIRGFWRFSYLASWSATRNNSNSFSPS